MTELEKKQSEQIEQLTRIISKCLGVRTLLPLYGEMSERLKEPVLKTGDAQASVGSNPTLSANLISICGSTQEAEGAPQLRE